MLLGVSEQFFTIKPVKSSFAVSCKFIITMVLIVENAVRLYSKFGHRDFFGEVGHRKKT